MNDCIFCKLINRESPAKIVFEDAEKMAFLELNQSAPGHVMVILKKHGRTMWDYNEKEISDLMIGVQKVAKKVKNGMSPDWLTIGINHEEKRGVPHLHIHIVPRWENDGGDIIQTIVHNSPKEDRETIAEKIRSAN